MRILLEAPILTQSGYGEHSRLVFRSIKENPEAEIFINPLDWGKTGWISSFEKERQEIENSIKKFQIEVEKAKKAGTNMFFDFQIHVGIPNEFEKRADYSICVTAGIETDRVSPKWLIKTHQGIDKIIVPSEHSKTIFEKTSYEAVNEEEGTRTVLDCYCPVEVVPYPVKTLEPKHLDFELETKFNFLSVALMGPRKNLENMVSWFIQEFRDENVGLVLKTGHVNGSKIDRHIARRSFKSIVNNKKHKGAKCKVYLLHGDLTESEIHSLYKREDIHAYISATHGEGYGLPIFEAAYSGMPVIATDWSGHLDFLIGKVKKGSKFKTKKLFAKVDFEMKELEDNQTWKDILEPGSCWANPTKLSFRRQLRNMYNQYGMYKKWASILKDKLLETHKKEVSPIQAN